MTEFNKNFLNDQDNYLRNYINQDNTSMVMEHPSESDLLDYEKNQKDKDEWHLRQQDEANGENAGLISTVTAVNENGVPGPDDDDDDSTLIPIEGDDDDDLDDDDDDDDDVLPEVGTDDDDDLLDDDDDDDDLLADDDDDDDTDI